MVKLHLGDCLEIMPTLPDKSVDAIIADWPYGVTSCKWDSIIPLDKIWPECKRVIKDRGAIVLFSSQPFTTTLIASNREWFKYCWYWHKNMVSGFQLAKIQPTRAIEEVCVFYSGQCTYNRQLMRSKIADRNVIQGAPNGRRPRPKNNHRLGTKPYPAVMNEFVSPRNVIEIPCVPRAKGTVHPTQKPVALLEYLVRTYTNEGDTVLDNTMGSGTTGEACANTGRNFIGIEKDETYFSIAKARLK